MLQQAQFSPIQVGMVGRGDGEKTCTLQLKGSREVIDTWTVFSE